MLVRLYASSTGVRDMLMLTSAVGAYVAGQDRVSDEGLLRVVMSPSGINKSKEIFSFVPCSEDVTTLDEAMQTNHVKSL